MQRFGNLKVGSVFGFFHPETVVSFSVFGFQKKKNNNIFFFVENRKLRLRFVFLLWFGRENRVYVPTTT